MENAQQQSSRIHALSVDDLRALYHVAGELKIAKDEGYFEKCFALQAEKKRQLFGVFSGEELAGYCIYNRAPKYGLFQKLNIPEIQDLNILPRFRRRGLASALILHCEKQALREGHAEIGIGVGLAPGFGAAQRLYVKLGYIPDGNGVTYDRKTMIHGEIRPNDDNLSLMMVKNLR